MPKSLRSTKTPPKRSKAKLRAAPARKKSSHRASMSDDAVQAKTGKTWPQWFTLLDKVGAKDWNHKEIVAHLVKHHKVGPWWQQMVTVEYEKVRGLRKTHERPDGYSISRSKTFEAPVARLFTMWNDPKKRQMWLRDHDLQIRSATPNKYVRVLWTDGRTTLETNFYPKGKGKCQVTVQHNKLTSTAAGERMKAYWGQQLENLQNLL